MVNFYGQLLLSGNQRKDPENPETHFCLTSVTHQGKEPSRENKEHADENDRYIKYKKG